jgi:hypothetical protein
VKYSNPPFSSPSCAPHFTFCRGIKRDREEETGMLCGMRGCVYSVVWSARVLVAYACCEIACCVIVTSEHYIILFNVKQSRIFYVMYHG